MKVYCLACQRRCKGEVLRVQEQYVHRQCFRCHSCGSGLEKGGFFVRDSKFYCPDDYQRQFGVRCRICNAFVVGEVITALGSTFHPACFHCQSCRSPFAPGDRVTLWSNQLYLCKLCSQRDRLKENVSDSWGVVPNGGGEPKSPGMVDLRVATDCGSSTPAADADRARALYVSALSGQHSPGSFSCPSETSSRRSRSTWMFGSQHTRSFLNMEQEAEKRTHPNDRYRRTTSPSVSSYSPQHFHLPSGRPHTPRAHSSASSHRTFATQPGSIGPRRPASVGGRRTPRSGSPAPDDDPLLQSLYPGGSRPELDEPAPVERDNWPGPPMPGLQHLHRRIRSSPEPRAKETRARVRQQLASGSVRIGCLGAALLLSNGDEEPDEANCPSAKEEAEDGEDSDRYPPTFGDSPRQRATRQQARTTFGKAASLPPDAESRRRRSDAGDVSYPELSGLRPTGMSLLHWPRQQAPKQFSLEELKARPKLADPERLEEHLGDEEFRSTFGMERRHFRRLPQWQRNELKRRVGL